MEKRIVIEGLEEFHALRKSPTQLQWARLRNSYFRHAILLLKEHSPDDKRRRWVVACLRNRFTDPLRPNQLAWNAILYELGYIIQELRDA